MSCSPPPPPRQLKAMGASPRWAPSGCFGAAFRGGAKHQAETYQPPKKHPFPSMSDSVQLKPGKVIRTPLPCVAPKKRLGSGPRATAQPHLGHVSPRHA